MGIAIVLAELFFFAVLMIIYYKLIAIHDEIKKLNKK